MLQAVDATDQRRLPGTGWAADDNPLCLGDIEIDVTDLEIGKTITLEEVKVEEGVEVMESLELPIVTVLPPTVLKKEEELEEAEEEAAEAGEEPTPEKPKEGEEG